MVDLFELVDEWGPEKVVCVSSRRVGMKGVLVIDNTARGMGKGGTRMSPTVTVREIARLARAMTYKWALVDLFYGGAKAGIKADPRRADKEDVLRSFVRALSNEVPREYVLGLDMGLAEQDVAIVQDELGDPGAAVGTPRELGGVPYDQLGVTGYGVAEVVDAAATRTGISLAGARVVIQGFGAVGSAAARRLHELGACVVAISTADGVLYRPDGLDVPALLRMRDEVGDAVVREQVGGVPVDPGAELTLPADVVVPAAVQDVIDTTVASRIQARIVVEAANLPGSAEAQKALAARAIVVVPDIVANAGAVIAAAYAMDYRHSPFRPEAADILATVSRTLRANTENVLDDAAACGVTTHEAAISLAQKRVQVAMTLKGRIPRDRARSTDF